MNKSELKMDVSMNITVKYVLTCLFLLIGIIGILGNLLVIISILVDSRMKRSLTNHLIFHVACCDLLILLFNIPDLIQFVSSINGNWILSEISCKLIRSILVLAQYASVLTMCAVTIERFIGIVYPLRSKFLREKKHVNRITLFVWIFSLICASPNLFYLSVITISPSRRSCLLRYSNRNFEQNQRGYIIHKSIESTIFYFIPLLLQLYSYTRIAMQLSHIDDSLKTSFSSNKKQTIRQTQVN
jgi:neuromedin U receptor 1